MRQLKLIVLVGIYGAFLFTKVASDAVFELKLISYINHLGKDIKGHCCSGYENDKNVCSGNCSLKFRVCLKVYQRVIDPKSSCTFGEKITPVLGDNAVDFSKVEDFVNPLSFKLDSWQGTFSLIIESYHEDNSSSFARTIEPVLVTRLMTKNSLEISPDWTEGEDDGHYTLLRYKYRVLCQEHYHGEGCRKWCRARDDSFGHYSCNEKGDTVCLPGWTGAESYCSTAVCSPGCKGFCEKPNECKCLPGWKGPRCDECKVYPGCLHGTCEEPWQCKCNKDWGGLLCNLDLQYCTNHKPCRNGALCNNTSPGSYSCKCLPGFNGTNCEIINDSCMNSPCKNGGTCLDTGNEGFVCQCPTGYTGRYCQLSGQTCADQPCLNGAPCTDTASGFACHCKPGYEGVTCERSVNDCLSAPCLNGGSCVDELNGFKCVCPVGFSGPRCALNKNDCAGNPCLNGGKCIDGLDSFNCECRPGFIGNVCQTKVKCVPGFCANGGTCVDGLSGFKCTCRPGWMGVNCNKPVAPSSPCASNPCLNGGSCKEAPELSSGYRCSCPTGLFGPRCSVTQGSLITSESTEQPMEPMSPLQIVLIVTFSIAVPVLVCGFVIAIICMKRKRRREMAKHDEEARRQNEQNMVHNAVNNKNLATKMIFNSLDYPCKPINTDTSQNYQTAVHRSDLKMGCSSDYPKGIDNSYSIVPARSTKNLNTNVSRLSLASKLEKDLDAYTMSRNSPVNVCKTPDPLPRTHSQSDVFLKRANSNSAASTTDAQCVSTNTLTSTCSPSTCTTPSSAVYVIEEHYNDENFIATEV